MPHEEVFTDMEKLKQQIEGRIAAISDATNEGRIRRQAFQDVIGMIGEI